MYIIQLELILSKITKSCFCKVVAAARIPAGRGADLKNENTGERTRPFLPKMAALLAPDLA